MLCGSRICRNVVHATMGDSGQPHESELRIPSVYQQLYLRRYTLKGVSRIIGAHLLGGGPRRSPTKIGCTRLLQVTNSGKYVSAQYIYTDTVIPQKARIAPCRKTLILGHRGVRDPKRPSHRACTSYFIGIRAHSVGPFFALIGFGVPHTTFAVHSVLLVRTKQKVQPRKPKVDLGT
jgi:hypothetical protein